MPSLCKHPVITCSRDDSMMQRKNNGFQSLYVYFLTDFFLNKQVEEQTHTYPTHYLSSQNKLLAKQSHCKLTEMDFKLDRNWTEQHDDL